MFLLFLMVLGAANVKAQVRIGGNAAPNASALLDLNADDTNNGTKGLALPRVNLTSNTMQLTSGVTNLTGMLVYNTTATLGVGIYSWIGGIWKKVDAVPATTPADSGKFLMSNGSSAVFAGQYYSSFSSPYPYDTLNPAAPVTFTRVFRNTIRIVLRQNTYSIVKIPGLRSGDLCYSANQLLLATLWAADSLLYVISNQGQATDNNFAIRCYRPSI